MKKKILFSSLMMLIIVFCTIYNIIRVNAQDEYREPDVNDNGQYEITCAGELKWIADNVNGHKIVKKDIILMNDINLSDYDWGPIGTDFMTDFDGTFDGNNKKITGLNFNYIKENYADSDSTGLFGYNTGVIKNLYVSGTMRSNVRLGGICGVNKGTIMNCVSNINVLSEYYGAGICYSNEGELINVGNEGYVSGMNVAGICYDNMNSASTIYNAYNVGDVEANKHSGMAAGICVQGRGEISAVYNIGNVTAVQGASATELSFEDVELGFENISEEYVLGGGLAYNLNNNCSDDEVVWRQVLGEDEYPVFYGDIVYYGYKGCGEKIFSNEYLTEEPEHDFAHEYSADGYNHYHKCNNCDEQSDVGAHIFEGKAQFKNELYHTKLCSVCNYNVDFEHVWQEPTIVQAEGEGLTNAAVYTCEDCGCKKTVEILIDEELPNGTLHMETTFISGLFSGNKKKVTVDAFDSKSGIKSIEYSLQEIKAENFDVLKWSYYKRDFKVNIKNQPYVYVRITDKCGNYIIIDKDNNVVHTGSYDVPKTYEGTTNVTPN